jgi:5-formyltetrahydrofolate cyclo-ligase
MATKEMRWAGRNTQKDELRSAIWSKLEETGVGVGPVWNLISDFVGAEDAAERLSQTSFWQEAKVIKSNPDKPQIPVRYRALRDGKRLYTPVPELVKDFPFLLLDPEELTKKGISFEEAAHIEGALEHGQRVQFTEMDSMDVIVVGSVAASKGGGRTGKGGGFADLELGIFSELGKVPAHAQILTTISDIQVVDDSAVPLQSHDYPLDWIFTPTQVIETKHSHPKPTGVSWDVVKDDQFNDIPFLKDLRASLEARA